MAPLLGSLVIVQVISENKGNVTITIADKLKFKVKFNNCDKIHQEYLIITKLYTLTNLKLKYIKQKLTKLHVEIYKATME